MLALTIAAVGLAGFVSYAVSRRRSELGIRSALGATPRCLVLLILRDVARVTFIGIVIGTLGSLASGRFVASLLDGIDPADVTTLVLAVTALALVDGAAALAPASRAARVEAVECLRAE